jgi:uncharacterized protein YbjQ (UPF0145 family)
MRTSVTKEIEGGRVLSAIGKIEAASTWHAAQTQGHDWRADALRALVRRAEDFDADAIVGLEYEVDGVVPTEFGVALERVRAKGIAVKLCA